jgi:hypothetical protein
MFWVRDIRWPVVLKPFYALLENISSTRNGALRLGLVTLRRFDRLVQNGTSSRSFI